MPAANN